MLSVLRIQNLAIIEDVEIEFGTGLNAITGETGAGKSIILRGLELLAGAKGSGDWVRHKAERCEVEGIFHLTDSQRERLVAELDWLADLLSDSELIIRRLLEKSGRGRIYINGRLSSRGELENLAPFLLDITTQHQQQVLLDQAAHQRLLDQFGVSESLLAQVREAFQVYSAAKRQLEEFRRESSAKSDYLRRIGFEHEELSEAKLTEGEKDELQQKLKRLSSSEAIVNSLQAVLAIIEGDSETSLERQLSRCRNLLDQAARVDPALNSVDELCRAAAVQVSETALGVNEYLANFEIDPDEIESMRARVADIARLERKYGKSEAELVAYAAKIAEEVAQYQSGAFDVEKLEEALQRAQSRLTELESQLRAERIKVGEKLSKAIQKEFSSVGMKQARLTIEVSPADSSVTGADRVEFLLAANPGEPGKSLAKVASGGELSRVLLILKTVLNDVYVPSVQVFDEVDVGIGGATARIVGEKIKQLTRNCQVILVTHAPQIAGLADRHLLVSKSSDKETTRAKVTILTPDGQISEVARMLAGKKISENFEQSARELLSK